MARPHWEETAGRGNEGRDRRITHALPFSEDHNLWYLVGVPPRMIT